MAFEQDCASPNTTFEVKANLSRNKKLNSSSDSITAVLENSKGCFDCNICLDTSHDPVVTLCGHLYCWPCIYKWLRVQKASSESIEQPKCPVCKAPTSSSSLVPLYGRGTSPYYDSEVENPKKASNIPHRPQVPATSMSTDLNQRQNGPDAFHHREYISQTFNNDPSMTPQTSTNSFYNPTIHMVSEMVFARIFGSSETNLFSYPYSNSYHGSPRLRRQEMQLDKSLNRVSIFLFCCFVLCLILF